MNGDIDGGIFGLRRGFRIIHVPACSVTLQILIQGEVIVNKYF